MDIGLLILMEQINVLKFHNLVIAMLLDQLIINNVINVIQVKHLLVQTVIHVHKNSHIVLHVQLLQEVHQVLVVLHAQVPISYQMDHV
jgi:hypothetical protein